MIESYSKKVNSFLNEKSFAIAGVSRKPQGGVGNFVMKKFIAEGYNVYPVHPEADMVDGAKCYRNLKAIPEQINSLFIATNPKDSLSVVKDCIENNIKTIWFHKAFGEGSYNKEAAELAEQNGITVIHSGCPMMFVSNADFGHRCFKHIFSFLGKLK